MVACLPGWSIYSGIYMFVRPCCLIIYWRSIVALTTSSHSTGSTQTKLENPLPDTEAPTTQQNTQRERHGNSRIFCQSFWRIFRSSFFSLQTMTAYFFRYRKSFYLWLYLDKCKTYQGKGTDNLLAHFCHDFLRIF